MARGYVGGPPSHDHTRACRSRSRRGRRGYTTGHARPSLSCPKLTDEADLPTVNNVPMLGRLKFANTDSGSLSALSQRAYQGCVVSLDAGTCSVDTKRSCLTGDACLRFTAPFLVNSATFDEAFGRSVRRDIYRKRQIRRERPERVARLVVTRRHSELCDLGGPQPIKFSQVLS